MVELEWIDDYKTVDGKCVYTPIVKFTMEQKHNSGPDGDITLFTVKCNGRGLYVGYDEGKIYADTQAFYSKQIMKALGL